MVDEKDVREKDGLNLKFKPMRIKEDIPIDFQKEPESNDDEDEPLIVGVEEPSERGKCIVCYKPIYENDNDVFRCPNCQREAHYLCATIFITEHEICPVCSTKLAINKDTGEYVALTKLD